MGWKRARTRGFIGRYYRSLFSSVTTAGVRGVGVGVMVREGQVTYGGDDFEPGGL